MSTSILTSVKLNLGLAEDYTIFDPTIIMHINTALGILGDLGVGSESGFAIEDKNDTWEDFLGTDLRLNSVKTYVSLRVRMLFDPPTTSFQIDASEKQIEMLEWRIGVYRESRDHPLPDDEYEVAIADGGGA